MLFLCYNLSDFGGNSMKIKNINEKFFRRAKMIGLSLCVTATGFSSANFAFDFYVGKSVKVSESVRESINSDYEFFVNDDLDMEEIEENFNNNKDVVDIKYNSSNLKNIYSLVIDGSLCGDLDILDYCKNLEAIYVKKFDSLSQDNIEKIQKLAKLKTLYMEVTFDYLLKNPDYKFDLSIFDDIENVYLIPCVEHYCARDVYNYIYFSSFKDYYNTTRPNIFEFFMYPDEIEDVIRWDKKFDEIFSEIPLSDCINEKEKIIQISKYINTNYEYDREIAECILDGNIDEAYNLAAIYNNECIDSFFSEKTGVCCNFASFVNILCFKAGIECYFIDGSYNNGENEVNHAWNFANIDNNYYIVDTTKFENQYGDIAYRDLDNYSSIDDSKYYDFIVRLLLSDANEEQSRKYKDLDSYMFYIMNEDKEEKNIRYYNENDGKLVFGINDKSAFVRDGLLMSALIISCLCFYNSLSNSKMEEEYEEEKELTKVK